MDNWINATTTTSTNDNLVPCKGCKCMILPTISHCPGCGCKQI
jgi:hypothetical protein